MRKLRYFAAGVFSLALTFSSFAGMNVALAVGEPVLVSVVAENTGDTSAKEAGDSIVFTFSESVEDIEITEENVDDIFDLSSDHSFLDTNGNLGDVDWSDDNTEL